VKKRDVVKIARERNRDLAIKFGKSLVEIFIKNYPEPTRAGTRKGEPIGFSRKKRRAALLMILYNPPSGLGLNEIAKIAGVSPGVLRKWRTEAAFKKAESEVCNEVGQMISSAMDIELMWEEIQSVKDARKEDGPNVLRLLEIGDNTILKVLKSERGTPLVENFIRSEVPKKQIKVVELDDLHKGFEELSLKIEGIDQVQMTNFLLKHLLFLNPLVANPLIQLITKKIELSIPGFVGLGLLLIGFAEVRDEKSLRKWKNRPEIKELTKKMIKTWIEIISDPEAWKELGPKGIKETAEKLKTFIFQELDL